MPAFQIRLSDEEMDALRERAGGASLAGYVRSVLFEPVERPELSFSAELEAWISMRSQVKAMSRGQYIEHLLDHIRGQFARQATDPDMARRILTAVKAKPNGVVPASELPRIAARR